MKKFAVFIIIVEMLSELWWASISPPVLWLSSRTHATDVDKDTREKEPLHADGGSVN